MTLSPSSFEILSDLLELRLESFLVTSAEETRELRQLKACQAELTHLRQAARQMVMLNHQANMATDLVKKPKISRRLQRAIHRAHEAQGRAAG